MVRNLIPFRNFLEVAAQSNGKILNISSIARDVGVDHTTVQNYFEILEDTLVGFLLQPFHLSVRKRQRAQSKFYFFDLGVQRALLGRLELPLIEGNFDFGNAFEHFIILEIQRLISYRKPDWRLSYFSSADNAEIDLIIERAGRKTILIEIKSTNRTELIDPKQINTLKKLSKDIPNSITLVVSQDKVERTENGIHYIEWKSLFRRIGLSDYDHNEKNQL